MSLESNAFNSAPRSEQSHEANFEHRVTEALQSLVPSFSSADWKTASEHGKTEPKQLPEAKTQFNKNGELAALAFMGGGGKAQGQQNPDQVTDRICTAAANGKGMGHIVMTNLWDKYEKQAA
jgi:hypothetical protein